MFFIILVGMYEINDILTNDVACLLYIFTLLETFLVRRSPYNLEDFLSREKFGISLLDGLVDFFEIESIIFRFIYLMVLHPERVLFLFR